MRILHRRDSLALAPCQHFLIAAEVGGEGFGVIRSGDTLVAGGDELADEGDLIRQPFRPGYCRGMD
jgi:hypothetical protein